MKEIILLTDYLNRFESKHDDFPYRSGMLKKELKDHFFEYGYNSQFISFPEIVNSSKDFLNNPILYTSQEDPSYHYKSFIEDIISYIENKGGRLIPPYKFLKANNNKVYMELIRKEMKLDEDNPLKAYCFGTMEEAMDMANQIQFPIVVKGAFGAQGTTVKLAKNKTSLQKAIRKVSSTRNIKEELREVVREFKYSGYKKQSKYRSKFILQEFIPNLNNDWKVYVFGDKIYVFYRPIFSHRGIRASGGGYDNYLYGKDAKIPDGLLDYAWEIARKLNTPFASLDIVMNEKKFHLLEFQLVYFGTAGILTKYSKEYFQKSTNGWEMKENKGNIEKVYVESVVKFLDAD